MSQSPPRPVRLIVETAPLDGAINMATDEIMLEQACRYSSACLRWYEWNVPTLSLGYFQQDSVVLPDLPRVRRLSGGGAIVHAAEWTYSFAAPRDWIRTPSDLYGVFHEAIVSTLKTVGCPVQMRGIEQQEKNAAFLCFDRGDKNDILVIDGSQAGQKIVGSAQRRRGSAVLQHGSIHYDLIVPISGYTTEHAVAELISMDKLTAQVSLRVSNALQAVCSPDSFSAKEIKAAEAWAEQKYRHIDWPRDLRRGPETVPIPHVMP